MYFKIILACIIAYIISYILYPDSNENYSFNNFEEDIILQDNILQDVDQILYSNILKYGSK